MFYHVEAMSTLISVGSDQIVSRDTRKLLKAALDHYHSNLGHTLVTSVVSEDGDPLFVFSHYESGD